MIPAHRSKDKSWGQKHHRGLYKSRRNGPYTSLQRIIIGNIDTKYFTLKSQSHILMWGTTNFHAKRLHMWQCWNYQEKDNGNDQPTICRYFKSIIVKLIIERSSLGIREIAFRWMAKNLIYEKCIADSLSLSLVSSITLKVESLCPKSTINRMCQLCRKYPCYDVFMLTI